MCGSDDARFFPLRVQASPAFLTGRSPAEIEDEASRVGGASATQLDPARLAADGDFGAGSQPRMRTMSVLLTWLLVCGSVVRAEVWARPVDVSVAVSFAGDTFVGADEPSQRIGGR